METEISCKSSTDLKYFLLKNGGRSSMNKEEIIMSLAQSWIVIEEVCEYRPWETDLAAPEGLHESYCVYVCSVVSDSLPPHGLSWIMRNPVRCGGARPGESERKGNRKCAVMVTAVILAQHWWLPWWNWIGCQEPWIWNHNILILSGRFCWWEVSEVGPRKTAVAAPGRKLGVTQSNSWPRSFCKQKSRQ